MFEKPRSTNLMKSRTLEERALDHKKIDALVSLFPTDRSRELVKLTLAESDA